MTLPARNSQPTLPWHHIGVLGLSLLAGCTTVGLGPDALEIANIQRSNIVPKSSPAAFIRAFDRFCVNRPATMAEADAKLRAASYVPARKYPGNGARVYLVDDRRPAVAISQNMCLVQARSRTGQTEQTRKYVAATFPRATQATRASARQLGPRIEQAWHLPGNPPAIIATERSPEPANHSRYALIFYQPQGKPKQ